jgi:hypothetical protein
MKKTEIKRYCLTLNSKTVKKAKAKLKTTNKLTDYPKTNLSKLVNNYLNIYTT